MKETERNKDKVTLNEAVEIVREKANGRIPIDGYETEHFYVFTSLSFDFDRSLGGTPTFAIDKETGEYGFLPSMFIAAWTPGMKDGWEQFRHYDSDETIMQDLRRPLYEF